jgi:integrase
VSGDENAMSVAGGYFYNRSEGVSGAIAAYRPDDAEHWEEIRSVVVAAVEAVNPPNIQQVQFAMKTTRDFVVHAWQVFGEDLDDPREIFSARNVERYVVALRLARHRNYSGRAGQSLALVSEALTGEWPEVARARDVAPAPYSEQELAQLLSRVRTDPTPARRHNGLVTIALGAGAGLEKAEIATLRRGRIDLPFIQIDGQNPHTVPVIPRWRELLEFDHLQPDDFVFAPGVERPELPSRIMRNHLDHKRKPTLNTHRLRSTWIVAMLTNPGGPSMFEMAYLTGNTVKSFDRYRTWVPRRSDEENLAMVDRMFGAAA